MITGVAFCPHPPLLIPEVAQRAASELDELRAACRTAIGRIAVPGRQLIVVGPGPASAGYEPRARGTLAGYGVPCEVSLGSDEPGPVQLPLSLTIGAWLVRDAVGPNSGAIGKSVGPDRDQPDVMAWDADSTGRDIALIVMGDGSARRSTTAPGYLDERAAAYDARVASALGSGEGGRLHRLLDGLGEELLASGENTWEHVAAALEGGSYDAELLYDAAPYGVGYFVAAWTARG